MHKLNFANSRERKWKRYHEFEKKQKYSLFKKLSETDGINTFMELSLCVRNLKKGGGFDILAKDRLKALARVHLVFNKVKI